MGLGQSQRKGEEHVAEKGKGNWCRKGKRKTRRARDGGGAEETCGGTP